MLCSSRAGPNDRGLVATGSVQSLLQQAMVWLGCASGLEELLPCVCSSMAGLRAPLVLDYVLPLASVDLEGQALLLLGGRAVGTSCSCDSAA